MKDEELLQILKSSIEQFYKSDKELINNNVHEGSIAHRIGFYFENIITEKYPVFYKLHKFDMEYNKNSGDPKKVYTQKNIEREGRPDFIVHERGNNDNNVLIIEFKKNDTKKIYINNDIYKLIDFTCDKREYKYQLGCFVFIGKYGCLITTFRKGTADTTIKYTMKSEQWNEIKPVIKDAQKFCNELPNNIS